MPAATPQSQSAQLWRRRAELIIQPEGFFVTTGKVPAIVEGELERAATG